VLDVAGRRSTLGAGCLRRLSTALALGLGATLLLASTGEARHASTASASLGPIGGVNIVGLYPGVQATSADRELASARALRAKLVRATVPWSMLQPRGPGQNDPQALAYLDRLTAAASANGIGVIMAVDSTPCWASSAPPSLLRTCVPGRWSKANAWPPRNPASYAAAVRYLAQRYRSRLTAIEIWNEPDQVNEAYFAGPNKAARYAALLRAAYPAIKQASPQVAVLAGSLVGSNGAFLRALYAAGIKGYYDGLAVHFYHLTLASVRSIHEVQLANGDATPLWLDEFGWSSCWPGQRIQQEQACVTSQTQGANIATTFRALSGATYVAAAVLYKLQDSSAEDFGVLSASGARKPAFAAFADALLAPFGSVNPVTLSLRRRGAHVLASGSGPVGDFIQLEAFRGGVLRYRALFTLDRFNRYAIALPSALGTRGLQVRVFQFWAGLRRDAHESI